MHKTQELKNMSFPRFQNRLSEALRPIVAPALRMSALFLVATAGAAISGAQTSAPVARFPTLDTSSSSAQLFSSSSDQQTPATEASLNPAGGVNFANYMQYGGGQRRRYGAPRYRGNNTNADGSNKWTGYAGVGLTQPIGNTWKYDTPSWAFGVGFGRQFSRHFAVPLEFAWDNFGLTKRTLDNQLTLYNNQIAFECPTGCGTNDVTPFESLDGNAHVWSFTLQPTYTIYSGQGLGAYVLAGGGYFHKVTNFTTPEEEEYFDPYYGYEAFTANEIVDHYTSNAPGVDAGFGLTYKFSKFSNERFYAEARYVVVFNSQRTGVNVNSPVNATTVNVADEYAPNSNRTTYFPIKFGIRF
jgi:hypothetical protein